MNNKTMLRTGIAGSGIMALCCFTPALVILVTVVGLSAVIGYLDYVLFPALGFFLTLTGYAVYRIKRRGGDAPSGDVPSGDKEVMS